MERTKTSQKITRGFEHELFVRSQEFPDTMQVATTDNCPYRISTLAQGQRSAIC